MGRVGGGAQSLSGQRHQTDMWTQKSVESPKTTWFHFLPDAFGRKINMSERNVTVPGRGRRVFIAAWSQGKIREANGEATQTLPRLQGQQ